MRGVVCRKPGRYRLSNCRAPVPAAAREWTWMQYRPPTGSIPGRPGVYHDSRRRGPGPLTSARPSRCATALRPTHWQGLGQVAAPHGPDGGPGRPRGMGGGGQRGRCADPGALADSGPPAPLQRPPQGRQELPLARRHAERGMAASGAVVRQGASARASATSAPTATRGRSAARSISWCAASPSARARTRSSRGTSGCGGPASSSTSTAAPVRAWGRSTTRPTTVTSTT